MKAIHVLGVSVLAVAMSASAAFAKVTDESKGQTSAAVAPLPKASTLADNVVVAPSGPGRRSGARAGGSAGAPTQVNVAPTESGADLRAVAPDGRHRGPTAQLHDDHRRQRADGRRRGRV